jgi:predicted RNase H-like nuclease (RuvC/YqgF family)
MGLIQPAALVAMTADAFAEQVVRITRENSELRAGLETAQARVKELEAQLAEAQKPKPRRKRS